MKTNIVFIDLGSLKRQTYKRDRLHLGFIEYTSKHVQHHHLNHSAANDSLEFLRPRRRCCSGVTAMVEGAMVYLKYFQKSNRALRLKTEAKASSVGKEKEGEII